MLSGTLATVKKIDKRSKEIPTNLQMTTAHLKDDDNFMPTKNACNIPSMFNTNNANGIYSLRDQEKDKSKRKNRKKSIDASKTFRNDNNFEPETPYKPVKAIPTDDWKLTMVAGDEPYSAVRKSSKSLVLVPGRMEILGDINNSSNEKIAGQRSSEEITSIAPSERNEYFLQEISQFPSSSQASISAYLMKRYNLQTPENDSMFNDVLKRLIKYLHKSWLSQTMCDAIIATDNGDILTHQVILAAYSPTLESLFEQNKRPLPQFVQINMNDYPKDTVMEIVNFLYTTNLKVDCKSIGSLVAVARQLDLPEIINICGVYLTKNYDHDSIFLHYSVAANNNLKNSKNFLLKVIAMNFSLLVHHNHFLYIPIDRLIEILAHEALSGEELDILLSVIKWIDFNRPERTQYSKQLFSHIRFELVDPEAIANQVEIHEWLFAEKANKDLLSEAYKYHALIGLGDNSKTVQRLNKQQLATSKTDFHPVNLSSDEFGGRTLHQRHSIAMNGSNNTNRAWANSAHQELEKPQKQDCLPDADSSGEHSGGFHAVESTDQVERLNEIFQQQRQIQLTQFQLEKLQRQLLEQTLQSGTPIQKPSSNPDSTS